MPETSQFELCRCGNEHRNCSCPSLQEQRIQLLTQACQIFTQNVAPGGYMPTIGDPATRKALALMKQAGVKPVYYGDGPETAR